MIVDDPAQFGYEATQAAEEMAIDVEHELRLVNELLGALP